MPLEQAVVGVDGDAAHRDAFFFGNDRRDVGYDADVVVADDSQHDGVLRPLFARPAGFYDAVSELGAQIFGIGAVLAVYFDASLGGDEPEYLVSENGVAAFRQFVVEPFDVLVDDQFVFAEAVARLGGDKVLGRAVFGRLFVVFLVFYLVIEVEYVVDRLRSCSRSCE